MKQGAGAAHICHHLALENYSTVADYCVQLERLQQKIVFVLLAVCKLSALPIKKTSILLAFIWSHVTVGPIFTLLLALFWSPPAPEKNI